MTTPCRLLIGGLSFLALLKAGEIETPRNELAFQLGGFAPLSRGVAQEHVDLGSGIALQVDYGHLVAGGARAALSYEIHFLANPLRTVTSAPQFATRDVATLFITPGLRLKFRATAHVSPYISLGGGLGWFEQSTKELDGSPNPASRELFRGAFDFGGGVDVPVWRFVALRGEARDFFTGSPNYNIASIRGSQNNVVVGAGFVIRWR